MMKIINISRIFLLNLLASLLNGCITYYSADLNAPHAKLGFKDFKKVTHEYSLGIYEDSKYCRKYKKFTLLNQFGIVNANYPITVKSSFSVGYNYFNYIFSFIPEEGHTYWLQTKMYRTSNKLGIIKLELLDEVGINKYKQVPFIEREPVSCLEGTLDFKLKKTFMKRLLSDLSLF